MESNIQSKRDELNKKLDELKQLKSSLGKSANDIKVDDVVSKLGETLDNYDSMFNEITNVDKQIQSLRKLLSKSLKEYEKTYDRIKELLNEQTKILDTDNLLSNEEIAYWRGEFNQRRLNEFQTSNEIKREIDKTRKQLTALNAKKNDLLKASKLGLTYQEYMDVTSTLKKKRIYEAIYNELGIGEIVSKKDKTKEDKEKIKAAKEEVLKAIASYSKENNASVLDSIRALYNLDITMTKKGTPKVVSLKTDEFNNLKINSDLLPAQVRDFGIDKVANYVPAAAPDDMLESSDFNVISKDGLEKILKYDNNIKDIKIDKYIPLDDNLNAYVSNTALDEELEKIKYNKESRDNMSQEEINSINGESNDFISFNEEELERRENETNDDYINRLTGMYDDAYDVNNVNVEYIPGTNVIKPRNRELYESEEEYANYLENYFIDHADEFTNEDSKVDTDTVEEFVEDDVKDDSKEDNTVKIEEEIIANPIKTTIEEEIIVNSSSNGDEDIKNEEIDTNKLDEIINANDPKLRIGMNDGESLDNESKITDTEVAVNFENKSEENNEIADTKVEVNFENRSDSNIAEEIVNETKENDGPEEIVIDQPIVKDSKDLKYETVTVLENDTHDQYYVRKYVAERYGLHSASNPARVSGGKINNALYYRISREDYEKLMANSENDDYLTPYKVVSQSFHRPYEESNENVEENLNNESEITDTDVRVNFEDKSEETKNEEIDTDKLDEIVNANDPKLRIGLNDGENLNNESEITDTDVEKKAEEEIDTDKLDNIVNTNDPNLRIGMNNDENLNNESENTDEEIIDREVPVEDNDIDDDVTIVTLFREINDNSIYAPVDFLDEFNIKGIPGTEIEVEGVHAFKISDEDHENFVRFVNENKDDKIEIRYQDINLKKKEDEVVNEDEDSNVVELKLFRDLDDNNQVYAPVSVLDKLGIDFIEEPVDVNGVPSIKISKRADEKINELANKSVDPKYVVKYIDVHLKKKDNVKDDTEEEKGPRPHVEAIIQKLTKDLNIKAKDGKRFMASNIHVAKKFKDELNSGNYLYNIVSITRKVISLPINLVRKFGSKLLLGTRGKQMMTELNYRLNDLSEEELDVLFEEYRGSQLKTDMNNQINPVILEKLREYGMKKVKEYNDKIGANYKNLFVITGQIDALEKQLANDKLSDDEKDVLLTTREGFVAEAANCIKAIEADRVKANNLLSGGVHGLEEDFKAVATKLSYVGMRFAKTNKFDNELQAKLGKYGQGLRDAMANGDNEEILKNFMALESEYSMNTEIKKVSLTGTKSVGSKYYTPLAERFDYRDDPFIRDLFTTVAVATSIYSAINAYKVHQIEQQKALADEQARAAGVNKHNDSVMNQVHQTGADIEARRGQFSEGMQAQGYDASLNNSGIFERGNLDANDWSFTDAYHAADHQAHIDYNAMHDQTVADIQNTISGYSTGALTEAQALQQMSNVANNAHQTLVNTAAQYKQICADYAVNHPQFDLHAFNDSIDYLVNNSNAITNMNQSMVDVTNMASTLSSLNDVHMTTLSSLPSDMYSSLMAAFATCCYAGGIAASMKNGRKNKYGNDITNMMNDYVYNHYEELTEDEKEEEGHKSK